ncbi:sodium:solute symporter [Fibrobacterota bacterium]
MYLGAIFVYLFVLVGIAVYKSKLVKTQDDFSVAGRTLSPWIVVLTMLAVWIGTGSIVGNAGKTAEIGVAACLLPLGSFFGMIILSLIATKARNIEVTSVPQLIGQRFGQVARTLAVVALILAYMVIVSYQFMAGGFVLEVITDGQLSSGWATVIAAAFIIIFTVMAGLMSLAYTDIITGSIIIGALVVGLPVLLAKAGGISGMTEAFAAMDKSGHMTIGGVFSVFDIINFMLPVFLLVMGDANQYQRIFASKSAKGAKQAVTVLIFVSFTIEILIILSAWVASSMTPEAESGKYILIYAAKHFMPLILGMIFLICVVGIIFSTANSFLLVPATTFIKDIYLNFINKEIDENDKKIVYMSRAIVVLFGVIALGVAFIFKQSTSVFERALYAYTIYGASITPVVVAALFWKRATKAGAVTSILCGTIVTLLWGEILRDVLAKAIPVLGELDAVLPAIFTSGLALLIVSLATKPEPIKTETA